MPLRAPGMVELGLAPSMEVPQSQVAKKWCIPQVSAEFVACMEDVRTFTRNPMPRAPGTRPPSSCWRKRGLRSRPYDYEYQRNGTRNLFMLCEPLAG